MVGSKRALAIVVLGVMILVCGLAGSVQGAGGDRVTILKAAPDNPAGRPGAGFRVTYGWQAMPLEGDYTVFVHVLDRDGRIALQDDHQPPTPTSKWNGLVTYARTVPLDMWDARDKRTVDVALAEGQYAICAGLYDKDSGQKISLRPGPDVVQAGEGRYRIGTLIVDEEAPIPGPGEPTLDLTGYEVTFNEEFNDLSISPWGPAGPGGTRWIAHTPWYGDFGDARFTDPQPGFPFTIQDGVLRIEASRRDGRWRSGLLSAVDPNGRGFKQQYGYFECRAKFPKGPGTWPAFWLMGTKSLKKVAGNTGPRVNPEVDVVEHYGHWPWRYHYVLHEWGLDGGESKHDGDRRFAIFGMEEDFHIYGVLIDAQEIVLYFDGVELHRERTPECVKTPLFPLVNLALGPGWPTDKTPDPCYMFVDYVKVWQKTNN